MNLKNIKYLSLLAFPAVLFSCAKEQQPDTPSDETVEVRLTLENGRLWKEADEVIVTESTILSKPTANLPPSPFPMYGRQTATMQPTISVEASAKVNFSLSTSLP